MGRRALPADRRDRAPQPETHRSPTGPPSALIACCEDRSNALSNHRSGRRYRRRQHGPSPAGPRSQGHPHRPRRARQRHQSWQRRSDRAFQRDSLCLSTGAVEPAALRPQSPVRRALQPDPRTEDRALAVQVLAELLGRRSAGCHPGHAAAGAALRGRARRADRCRRAWRSGQGQWLDRGVSQRRRLQQGQSRCPCPGALRPELRGA
ncbi:hypothetical protein D3C75_948630 [compost metagenome]